MYKLIFFENSIKHEVETETYEEILSVAIDAFNNNHELIEIQKENKCLLLHCEVYEKIGKVIY
jgi:hypothetical protein